MAAGRYSFTIEQGATLNLQINWTDGSGSAIDLAGYQARMQVRPTVESSTVYLNLSSSLAADGTGINLSGSSGETPLSSGSLAIYVSAYSSSLLNFDTAVYDLELVKDDYVTRLLEGQVRLSKNITR